MGSPLTPILANIFMGFYESKWLNEYNLNKPNFYLRCVGDILAAFEKEQHSLIFFQVFKIRRILTINLRSNEKPAIPSIFFDILISGIKISKSYISIISQIYPEHFSNFKSFTSFSYKISLIKYLIDRSFKSCNNCNSFHHD